jgi:hypothetical protein
MESTEHRWVTGIQWHPERPEPDLEGGAGDWQNSARSLWHAFVAACS